MDEQLQAQYDALETEKATLNPDNPDDKFRLTVIQQEQDKIKAQAAEQDRLQQQAEAVATVTLPQDYDSLWGVSGANEEITSLIKQAYETAFAAGNDELAKVQEEKIALAAQVAELQSSLDSVNAQLREAIADKLAAQEAQADAESKRDNAVKLMEEAQAERNLTTAQVDGLKRQIDELEGMLRTYKSRSSAATFGVGLSGIKFTSTIKPESDEERKAREERERIEQINKGLARLGSEPLPLPPSPGSTEAAATVEQPAHDDRFPVDAEAHDAGGLAEGNAPVEVAGEDAQELTLEQKVNELWAWKAKVEAAGLLNVGTAASA
jgi:chromosome segregation ATPase